MVSLNDNFDANTPSGKLMMQLFSILAEYERNLIIERTQTGRKVAMKNGKKMGRPKKSQECESKYLRPALPKLNVRVLFVPMSVPPVNLLSFAKSHHAHIQDV